MNLDPQRTVFVILSFEGPDQYSQAGGLGVRVKGLSRSLARMGYTTYLYFCGDPDLPGEEAQGGGRLQLRRWCQWISALHRGGVYDGEEGKIRDWNYSLPASLIDDVIAPAAAEGKWVVVLGEEWHTSWSMRLISDSLYYRGLRNRVVMLWNANNTYGFNRIDWASLNLAATVTTVSRYMKFRMWEWGQNPIVIPNGIPQEAIVDPDAAVVAGIRAAAAADQAAAASDQGQALAGRLNALASDQAAAAHRMEELARASDDARLNVEVQTDELRAASESARVRMDQLAARVGELAERHLASEDDVAAFATRLRDGLASQQASAADQAEALSGRLDALLSDHAAVAQRIEAVASEQPTH